MPDSDPLGLRASGAALPRLCVVGNINRDVKVRGVPSSAALLKDGETSISGIAETMGGGGANSACAAAALGAQVRFVGKVGGDALGARLRQTLQARGVTPFLARDQECATGTTVAIGFDTGNRHFLSRLPNNESLSFDDIDLEALDGCSDLLRADVWFSEPMLEGGNQCLLAEARRRGLTTSLDINFDPRWLSSDTAAIARRKQQVRDILGLVDLAHGNVAELCAFSDSPDLEIALGKLKGWGTKAVVVHLGRQGAGYSGEGQLLVELPRLAEESVNSTGTGDVLSICMILLQRRTDLPVRERLRLANSVVRDYLEGRLELIPAL